jgi:putative PIN family toxin of toxin-antitoxin system
LLRIVADTSVLVSAVLASSGPPAMILDRWRGGEFDLVVSPRLLEELEAVLMRPKFQAAVSEEDAREYVDSLAREAFLVSDPEDVPSVTPDPEDDYLVALAVAAGADAIVSGDSDLTELEDPPVLVLTPRRLVARLAE